MDILHIVMDDTTHKIISRITKTTTVMVAVPNRSSNGRRVASDPRIFCDSSIIGSWGTSLWCGDNTWNIKTESIALSAENHWTSICITEDAWDHIGNLFIIDTLTFFVFPLFDNITGWIFDF